MTAPLKTVDSTSDTARLSIASTVGREWPVASTSAPIHRVDWLDNPPIDSTLRRALGRACDQAAAYDEKARIALVTHVRAHSRVPAE